MELEQVVEKLRALGVFSNNLRENAEIFKKSKTLDDVKREVIKWYPACGSSQFVYIHLVALLKHNPEYTSGFLEESKRALGKFGIKPEHIVEYFQSGTSPIMMFTFEHGKEYNIDDRIKFYQMADQFALDKIREWLGIQKNS